MVESPENDVPPSVAAFAERLSPRVRAALPRWEWTWHPERCSTHEEIRRDLAAGGFPEWPFLWPLEEAFGGVEVQIGGCELRFGIAAEASYIRRAKLLDEDGRGRFVALGEWGNDLLVADATGRVSTLTENGVLTEADPSFESFLENQAMSAAFAEWSTTLFTAHLMPKTVASEVAARLGVPPVPEVFNDIYRWWQDDGHTVYEGSDADTPSAVWGKTLTHLVEAIDAAVRICPTLKVKPVPSYDDAHKEILGVAEIRARAPTVETLAARPGARRVELLGEPSIFPGKPVSTGDVWIAGEGETLRIDVLERRDGEIVNFWEVTPTGTHALLMSWYGKG
jgi:hypothetical protein